MFHFLKIHTVPTEEEAKVTEQAESSEPSEETSETNDSGAKESEESDAVQAVGGEPACPPGADRRGIVYRESVSWSSLGSVTGGRHRDSGSKPRPRAADVHGGRTR